MMCSVNASGGGESSILRGESRLYESMSRYTTWRVGGLVQRLYIPADLEDFVTFLSLLPENEPLWVLGLGSNLLVRDGGLPGTAILLYRGLDKLQLDSAEGGHGTIYAEAGVADAKVARFAARNDLTGVEFFANIPGTVGGALAMNAGCFGAETWQVVNQVMTVDRVGKLHQRSPADYNISYRHVTLKPEKASRREEWFVAAWFKLQHGAGDDARRKMKDMLTQRAASQPLNQPNAGSVFRNPPGDYAARLIEASGLKGTTIGGAMVSPRHANFIVNTGAATAADIEQLIEKVRETVAQRCGVVLHCEVKIIGERV